MQKNGFHAETVLHLSLGKSAGIGTLLQVVGLHWASPSTTLDKSHMQLNSNLYNDNISEIICQIYF